MLRMQTLDHITITVSDVERSLYFYRDILGLVPKFEWPGELTMLSCGASFVAIAHWNQGKPAETPPAIAVDHFAFRVDRETFAAAQQELPLRGVPIDHISDHGICHSLYVRDPDRHLVELTCYEMVGHRDRMPVDVFQRGNST